MLGVEGVGLVLAAYDAGHLVPIGRPVAHAQVQRAHARIQCDDGMHPWLHHHLFPDRGRHGMGHHTVGVYGVDAQGVRNAPVVHGMHQVIADLSGALVIEGHGHIGLRGLSVRGHQADLGRGRIQCLGHHHLQHMFEELGGTGVEIIAHALQRVLLRVAKAHTDNEGLQHDASRLECATDGTGVLITGFDAIGDEDDDVPYGPGPFGGHRFREVLRRTFQGPGDRSGTDTTHGHQGALHVRYAVRAERDLQVRVVAILLTGLNGCLMAIEAQGQLQVGLVLQFLQRGEEQFPRRIDLRLVAPESVHAVARVHHEQHACERGLLRCLLAVGDRSDQESDAQAQTGWNGTHGALKGPW